MTPAIVPARTYLVIFGLLMALLFATVAAAYIDLGQLNLPLAMAIASVKALLIIVFLMHLRHASRLTQLFASIGFFWLAILLLLAMSDYVSRLW